MKIFVSFIKANAVLKVQTFSFFKINILCFFLCLGPLPFCLLSLFSPVSVFQASEKSLENETCLEITLLSRVLSSLCLVTCHTIASLIRYYRSSLSLGRLSSKSTHPGCRWCLTSLRGKENCNYSHLFQF